MIITRESERRALQEVGKIVANCLQFMHAQVEVGISTKELDDLGRDFLIRHGAQSAPEVMYDFPGATCISLNYEAAHGVPSRDRIIAGGDIINIDVSAVKNDFYGDTGGTRLVGKSSLLHRNLCKATWKAMMSAIEAVTAGCSLNVIGKAIESEARNGGFTIIRNLCSHGVGKTLHDEPDHILSFYDPNERRVLQEGTVITIEPFLSTGSHRVKELDDGWTLVNDPGFVSAQYEHTLIVTKDSPQILTVPDEIYEP